MMKKGDVIHWLHLHLISIEEAARISGVRPATIKRWLDKDEKRHEFKIPSFIRGGK